MRIQERVNGIVAGLKKLYPDAECSLAYKEPYQLLFATRLSAQCTDARVNIVTRELYSRYKTLEEIAACDISELEKIVHPCGVFRMKAKDIRASANMLIEKFGGKVPDTMEELLTLPGVGRKTANLILGDIYGKPAIVADTHCIRISNRLGLVDNLKDPTKIEMQLRKILPPEHSSDFCHCIVLHGRAVCDDRKPNSAACCLKHLCQTYTG